jgi:hypothetical protein
MHRILSLVLALSLPLAARAAKGPDITVRLNAEGNPKEGETFTAPITLTNPPKEIVVQIVPIITEKDIVAIYPFTNGDGSIGSYLKLDANGQNKLEQYTASQRDTLAVAFINGRVGCAMMVDKKITDGILLIASGFQPREIAVLQTKFPTMGDEKNFAAQKKKALELLKEVTKNEKATPKSKK